MSDTPDTELPDMNPVEPLRRAIGERYLTYALSTIMNRARCPTHATGSSLCTDVFYMR